MRKYKQIGLFNIVILTVLISNFGYSQEAKKLFQQEYSKVTFVIQPAKITGYDAGNIDRAAFSRIHFKDADSFQFGIHFNFAQIGSFNFKTGLIIKQFAPSLYLNVGDQEFESYKGDEFLTIRPIDEYIYSIPIKTEYFLKLTSKTNLVLGAGLSLNLIAKKGIASSEISIYENGKDKSVLVTHTTPEQLSMSGEFSLGVNYRTSFALFQLDAFYSRNVLDNVATGRYQILNFSDKKIREGYLNIYGDFYGLSLSISPKKGVLKKKSKKG